MTSINPLPLRVIHIENGGVRLCDGQTSDVWNHPKLTQALANNEDQVHISASGSRLCVRGKDGRIRASIAGEELVSSLHHCFPNQKAWSAKKDPGIRRAQNR